MRKQFVRFSTLEAFIARLGPAYAAAVEQSILERTPDGAWVDSKHDGYLTARKIREAVDAPAHPAPRNLTLEFIARVAWPHRGALVWQWLRSLRDPTPADIAAVGPLIEAGGCQCRGHWYAALLRTPPVYDLPGWRRWLYDRQQEVNARIGRRGIHWSDVQRRYDWADRIGGVFVISLARTPERLDAFWRAWPADWPLQLPTVLEAVDGKTVDYPPGWFAGIEAGDFVKQGANGCRLSHLKALNAGAAADPDRPYIVLEDDARFNGTGGDAVGEFLDALPADFEMAFLGCQHVDSVPLPVNDHVVRCVRCERTHALAVHPRYFDQLRTEWTNCPAHIDWRLGQVGAERKFYAASPQLASQGENHSTIVNNPEPHRSWSIMHVPHYEADRSPIEWDRAVVINLASRPDRLEAFRQTVAQSKLLSSLTIERFDALTTTDAPAPTWWTKWKPSHYACRASHLAVMRDAIRDRVKNLLVFEDDVQIYGNFDARVKAFAAGVPANWWGYQLGGFTWGGHNSQLVAPGVMRMGGIGGLHCYCLNAMGIQRAYDHILWHATLCLDEATAQLYREEPHFYMPDRFFVSQSAGFSDNEGREVDFGREYEPVGGYGAD